LKREKRAGIIWYLLKWRGYPEVFDQWVPEEDLQHAPELLNKFNNKVWPGVTHAPKRPVAEKARQASTLKAGIKIKSEQRIIRAKRGKRENHRILRS
jgi:hypothetical protein